MSGAIAAACVGAAVTIATTATTIGMQESAKNKASAAAKNAAAADANERARQQRDAESEEMAGGIMAMVSTGAASGGDPAVQQYLEQMGYLQPGAAPGGATQLGTPGQPADPSGPRQPSNPNQGPGGGPPGGIPV